MLVFLKDLSLNLYSFSSSFITLSMTFRQPFAYSVFTLSSNIPYLLQPSLTMICPKYHRGRRNFNLFKTESVPCSRIHQKQHNPSLLFDNVHISQVSTHTHIGVTFTPDGKWQSHISSNTNKVWQRIGILRTLKCVVSRSALYKMYITFIRPLLEYADIIWDNCNIELKKWHRSCPTWSG